MVGMIVSNSHVINALLHQVLASYLPFANVMNLGCVKMNVCERMNLTYPGPLTTVYY